MSIITSAFLLGLYGVIANGTPIESNRIVGGDKAPYAYSPHMAALLVNERTFLCGGSIISKTLILTAAHCIEMCLLPNMDLLPTCHGRVGSNYWNSGGTVVTFSSYYMHPEWDRWFIKNDAGILVSREELALNEFVQIIPLNYDFVEEERSFVTGWGMMGPMMEDDVLHLAPSPVELQLLYVNTIAHDRCQQVMTEVTAGFWVPPIERDVEICTLHSPGHGMCNGDSGSALVKVDTREQIGIVSWGIPCALGAPDVFVRIYGMKDFLKPLMDKHSV